MNQNVQVLERKIFPAGALIFREGEEGNRAYVVQSGMVEIIKNGEDGEAILGTIVEGGIFGEMALVDDQPRMASARAVKSTTLIAVPREVFRQKLATTDPFIRALLNIFVKNIRAMAAARRR